MAVQTFYIVSFIISLVFTSIYIFIWHKHFNPCFNIIFTLVPVSNIGYILYSMAVNLESSIIAIQITYIGGCFLQLFIVLSIFSLCSIPIPRLVRTAMFVICAVCYASVLTIGKTSLFYKKVSFEMKDGYGVLIREYGPMHTVFYVVLFTLFVLGFIVIIYSWFRKKQVPRRILLLLILPDTICILSFFVVRRMIKGVDFVPAGYCAAEAMFLLIAFRVNLYDVADTVIDSIVRENVIGYISFDDKFRYLGSNEVAKRLLRGLNDLAVDEKLRGRGPDLDSEKDPAQDSKQNSKQDSKKLIWNYIENFIHQGNQTYEDKFRPETDQDKDKTYKVSVNYLYDGNRRKGYLITFTDDTANQKYIDLIGHYNEKLTREVEEKTSHIVEMHDNLIMSLAVMVESRDNSTGGHIKRTSEGVRILINEIKKEGNLALSDEFCNDVVKAAPMHDLGKIAVDDAVLRKPGRFTPEEYEKMKAHAAEGARVIHEVLRHTDDESFKVVAENVAHYHHERWDGSGYPEKLAGDAIPIEARIMAVADVYDALVSKRVYKDAFDFEKANSIIMEGMGTQFDPGLKMIYEKSRPYLEAYYSSV